MYTLGTSLTQTQKCTALPSKCAWASLTPQQAGYATILKGTHRMHEDWTANPTKPHRVAGSSLGPKDLGTAMS